MTEKVCLSWRVKPSDAAIKGPFVAVTIAMLRGYQQSNAMFKDCCCGKLCRKGAFQLVESFLLSNFLSGFIQRHNLRPSRYST